MANCECKSADKHLKYKTNKENIPIIIDNNTVMHNNLRFKIYKSVDSKIKQIVDHPIVKNDRRIPLKDINKSNSVSNTQNKFKGKKDVKLTRECGTQKDFDKEQEDEFEDATKYETKARDSYPLNVNKLNSAKNQSEEILLLNTQHITYERKYDSLQLQDPLSDDTLSTSDSLFFNDSLDNNYHDVVLGLPYEQEIKRTPVIPNDPPESFDIKFLRKQHLSKVKSQEVLGVSPLVLHCKEEIRNKCLKKEVLGTVNLDANEPFVNHSILYTPLYLESAICHMLKKETTYIKSPKAGTFSDSNRSVVVNWLIKLQNCMKTDHNTLYTAVRLFDGTIYTKHISVNLLQLVALTSFWISLKYHAADAKAATTAKYMAKLTAGAYTSRDLSKMELDIFKAVNFNINPIDITVFIHYYILYLNIANADVISESSHYLLTCSYLSSTFVQIPSSKMAAGAVFTSLYLMNEYSESLWSKLKGQLGYYSPKELILLKELLINVLQQVNDPSFPCREPLFKYSSSKHHRVSLILKDNLSYE